MEQDLLVRELLDEEKTGLSFKVVGGESGLMRKIRSTEVRRPGLAIAGFLENFEPVSVQVLGNTELAYLESLPVEAKKRQVDAFFATGIPAVVVTRKLQPHEYLIEAAKRYEVPILLSEEGTSRFIHFLSLFLERSMSKHTTVHGALVDVFGVGVLIMGESGVGKSETALELIHRGHRVVSDDIVEIRRIYSDVLIGTSPELTRHHMEIRGLGIINVRALFGVSAIIEEMAVDLAVELEKWDEEKEYDRLGLDDLTREILGIKVPFNLIPVQPGRNLAVIIEVGAINQRLKNMGVSSAQELNRRLTDILEKDR